MLSFRREVRGPKILVTSLPKAGTHLVMSCYAQFPNLRYGKLCIDNRLCAKTKNLAAPADSGVPVGIDSPCYIRTKKLEQLLQGVGPGHYIAAHLPYSTQADNLILREGVKCVAIIRDPRDVVTSHVQFIMDTKSHFLHKYYQSLSNVEERIMTSICGIDAPRHKVRLRPIADRVRSVADWSSGEDVCFLRFEDLVGARGGGSARTQEREIRRLGDHAEIDLPEGEIPRIAKAMFGGSYTFRKGQVGGWREMFSAAHKDQFKAVCGELLIELGYEASGDW